VTRIAPVLVGLATVATTLLAVPASARAQAGYGGPGVVPPPDAYVDDTVVGRTRLPARWRLDAGNPRTVWIHFAAPPSERPEFWRAAGWAVEVWNDVHGLLVTLRVTEHPRAADIELRWTPHYDESRAGTTDWTTDGEGWLAAVTVTLAAHHVDGTPMSDEFLRFVALHELGHALGLPHSSDPGDVMHPGNRNRRLSERDVRSVLRLYDVPPALEDGS